MIRRVMMPWALATAAVLTFAAARGAIGPDDTRPFEVRVVDARHKGVPKVAVAVAAPDRPRRSFDTDQDGLVTIPAGIAVEGAILSASRGRESVAWAQAGDPMQAYHDGTQGLPILMKLIPLTHRVEGSVVDHHGKPIAGARLVVGSLFHSTNRFMAQDASVGEPLLGSVESDRDGRFALMLPEATRARLRALHPRYVGRAIGVSEAARTLVPATLIPAGEIVGQVTDLVTGRPVAGASVAAQLIDRPLELLDDGWGQSTTDDRGRFSVGGLEPGVYNLLLLEVPGRGRATAAAAEGIRVDGGSEATASLSVIEGRPMRGVVIDRGSGRPMADAQVGCQGSAVPRSGAAMMGTRTDAKGRFAFHVPPGEQFVYLIDDVSASRMSRRSLIVPEQGEVVPMVLLQPPPGSSEGVPPPPADGPVAVATVPALEPATTVAVPAPVGPAPAAPLPVPAAVPPTTVAGVPPAAFMPTRVAPAPAGPPTVAEPAAAPSAAAVAAVVEVNRDPNKPAVSIVHLRNVIGRVRDAKGRPIAGVRVGLGVVPNRVDNLRDQPGSVATDREGAFVLRGIPRDRFPVLLGWPRCLVQREFLPADRDEVELTYRFPPDEKARHQAALVEDEAIPPDLRPRLTFIDLTPYATNYLTDGPGVPGDGNNLDRLPRGVHKLSDSYFRIGDAMVQVKGRIAHEWPESVAGIKVAARGAKLHILHATEQQTESGTELGRYVIHYADGSQEKIPIVYGRNLVDWWHYPSSKDDPSAARIAWTGTNETTDRNRADHLSIRLFAFTWTNPHPAREIATIDVVSSDTACDPFLIAVTLERPGIQ